MSRLQPVPPAPEQTVHAVGCNRRQYASAVRARPSDFRRFFRLQRPQPREAFTRDGSVRRRKGCPAAQQAVQATGLMLVAGGLSVVAGIKPHQGLATLIGFLVPVTLQMHRFWDEKDPEARQREMTNFMKNMALVGAALALMEIREPWPVSVDAARARTRKCSFDWAVATCTRYRPESQRFTCFRRRWSGRWLPARLPCRPASGWRFLPQQPCYRVRHSVSRRRARRSPVPASKPSLSPIASERLAQVVLEMRDVVAHEIVQGCRFRPRNRLPRKLVEVVRGSFTTERGVSADSMTQAMCWL